MKSTLAIGLASYAALANGAAIDSSTLAKRAVWQPAVGAKWQIDINNAIDPSKLSNLPADVLIWDIDLFMNTNAGSSTAYKPSTATISALKAARPGTKVICYFNAGAYQPDLPDNAGFNGVTLGNELDGWPGEHWLPVGNAQVRAVMSQRIAWAAQAGCDGIDPDNMDGYTSDNNSGLSLTQADLISYVKFLAGEAAKNNLAIGLKNAGDIISSVISVVQFSVNEQCAKYKECATFNAFITANKPVFHIEYDNDDAPVITFANACAGTDIKIPTFSTVYKHLNLDGYTHYCDGTVVTTGEK